MKKKILMIIACIGFCTAVNAQPTPSVNPSNDAQQGNYSNTVKGEGQAPIAPATLLLLGLGASAVGATVYRNQKQKED